MYSTRVGRALTCGEGGRVWIPDRVKPHTLKMIEVASLLGAQGLRVSITTDVSVSG